MLIRRPKDFELNQLFDTVVSTIKSGDNTMQEYEFQYDKKLKDIKDSSPQATEARTSIHTEKYNKIREKRISTVESILSTVSEELEKLKSKH